MDTLTPAQCVLLAVHLATESNIAALHSFTPSRSDVLNPELVLRILLTYLPEAVHPSEYTNYVEEVSSRLYVNTDRQDVIVSTAPVQDLNEDQAKRRLRKLRLLPTQPPNFPPHAPDDLLTRFLCHRAYRIDAETGLIGLLPALIEPFLTRNEYLQTWFISVVLPILRLETEYYPEDKAQHVALTDLEKLSGREGVDMLLRKAGEAGQPNAGVQRTNGANLGRDIKSLVGPWMFGHTDRKRRKLIHSSEEESTNSADQSLSLEARKIGLSGFKEQDRTGHDWEYVFQWMTHRSTEDFSLVAQAIEDWDGPGDVDLGNFGSNLPSLDEDLQQKLEVQYAQMAFASCYAAQANEEQTVREAHGILARLAELLDFVPPPDLATTVDALPRIERHATSLEQSNTVADLSPKALLRPEHPLTTPRLETYMLLQMMVYSAYQFLGLGCPLSLVNVAKLHFFAAAHEQPDVLKRILRYVTERGVYAEGGQWTAIRARLLWLWSWGIESNAEDDDRGAGLLGKISKLDLEEEILKSCLDTNCYQFVQSTYLSNDSSLPSTRVEGIILGKIMEAYDSASNGNKTRGTMKKVNEMILAFQRAFSNSIAFQQVNALLTATHALSFYSLTLEHGVPFQPVSIRASHDPVSLLGRVLEQNPRSYTKLDDLIDIARHLVNAGLCENNEKNELSGRDSSAEASDVEGAAKRVTFMAIESALREDDFETAYSYIINRLTPSNTDTPDSHNAKVPPSDHDSIVGKDTTDDVSWRAAFLAGRFRPSTTSPPTLRRLEQRTELLSLALLLAPGSALTEILFAWRKCEEELTSLRLSQQAAEDDFDDHADKRLSAALPGTFNATSETEHSRRDLGRMAGGGAGGRLNNDETPLSMFDLTRNAARALSKNAFPLRDTAGGGGGGEAHDSRTTHARSASLLSDVDDDPQQQQRVRKRDVVTNAVGSGLAWVLGAQQHLDSQHR